MTHMTNLPHSRFNLISSPIRLLFHFSFFRNPSITLFPLDSPLQFNWQTTNMSSIYSLEKKFGLILTLPWKTFRLRADTSPVNNRESVGPRDRAVSLQTTMTPARGQRFNRDVWNIFFMREEAIVQFPYLLAMDIRSYNQFYLYRDLPLSPDEAKNIILNGSCPFLYATSTFAPEWIF